MTPGPLRGTGLAGVAMRVCLLAVIWAPLGGCALMGEPAPPPSQYRLDATVGAFRTAADGPVVVVGPTGAAGGYDTTAMRYRVEGPRLARYATGVWVEPPAAMLNEAVVAALGASGHFQAVAAATDAVSGDLRLSMQLQQLVHVLPASGAGPVRLQVRMTLIQRDGRVRAADVVRGSSGEVPPGPANMAEGARVALENVLERVVERVSESAAATAAQ